MNNLNKIKSETDLIVSVSQFLNENKYDLKFEVPSMGQSADIVALKKDSFTIIEAKMHDWRKGLNQCKAHELIADYICIAIATVNVSERLEISAKSNGYGIIHCNPKTGICDWFMSPQINQNIWNPQRKSFMKTLRSFDNEY